MFCIYSVPFYTLSEITLYRARISIGELDLCSLIMTVTLASMTVNGKLICTLHLPLDTLQLMLTLLSTSLLALDLPCEHVHKLALGRITCEMLP